MGKIVLAKRAIGAIDLTSLLITHRFTTAMCADLIYVMDCGRVVESGTHAQLLQQDGLYAKSWKEQMKAGKGVDNY